jgi:hypothetical protein
MKNLNKFFQIFGLITLILLLFSCGASHSLRDESLYKDDSFAYDHLKNNTMIIGGIASQMIKFTNEDRIRYSSIVSNILVEELEEVHKINMISTRQLISKIKKDDYFAMMEDFDLEHVFVVEDIRFIRDAVPNAKYILLAYIENENIIDRSYDEYVEVEGEEQIETDYEKTYLLTIDFQLYDLLEEKMVWKNVIYNQAERTETRTTETGCFESCMDNMFQTMLFGSPAEIDRDEVIAETVERLAKNLAKAKI